MDVVWDEAACGASGVAQRAAGGEAGGHRRSSEKARVADPGTEPETSVTEDGMTLMERVETSADADLVRDMLACAAGRRMEMDVEAATGAPRRTRRRAVITPIAPRYGRRRREQSPIFEVRPHFSLPPLQCGYRAKGRAKLTRHVPSGTRSCRARSPPAPSR